MPADASVHERIGQRLVAMDQRYTPLRRALVDTMAIARRPLTIPELLHSNPGLSQSSAYRNMTALMEADAVRRVTGSDDHGRFELAEEHSGHHHHLVCAACGSVTDVAASPLLERAFAQAAKAAAAELAFEVTDHRFDLVGTCHTCR
ncbi:MAG: Fur family transcriptional regulator [Acidimicrobiales bacterium]